MSRVGLDTNILLRISNRHDVRHDEVMQKLAMLEAAGCSMVICHQVLAEFWVVATRPETANGLGNPVGAVDEEITRLIGLFTLAPETPLAFSRWRKVVVQANVTGVRAHDARLACTYALAGCDSIYTFNTSDFKSFLGDLTMTFA